MKTILHLSRFAWYMLAACLVATALAMTLVRVWLLPRAAEWRGELQTELSRMSGETVTIKALSAQMRGFKPELVMRGLRIENAEGGAPLEFERLGVGLDLVDSVWSKSPAINRIDLEGARLRLIRLADGKLTVAGVKPGEAPPAWLFIKGEVRFTDIDLELADGGPAMPLGRAHVRLRNQGNRHFLDARVDLPGKLGKSVRLSAEVDGNPLSPSGWDGRAYAEVKRLREGAFAESLPLRLRSGEANLQAWGEWQDGALQRASGKLELDRPVFLWHSANRPDGLLALDKLGGWLAWHKEDGGFRLDVRRFNLAHKGRAWPETDFALATAQAPDGSVQTLKAAVSYLRIEDALALLGTLPVLDEASRETLKDWSPHGEVRDAKLVYQADGHLGFCGELADLGFKPGPERPGLGRFNGRLCGDDRNGQIEVNLTKTELNLPGLFPKPLTVDTLEGQLAWSRSGEALAFADWAGPPPPPGPEFVGPLLPVEAPSPFKKWLTESAWRLAGNRIRLTAPGLNAETGFSLELPSGEGTSPSIDLSARLREVDAARLRDYLPLTAMDAATAGWHGNAYQGGKISEATVLLRGRLADFPFPNGEGLFEVQVRGEGIELNFNPQWPHLYGVKAKILFFGPAMFINSEGGRIGEIPLQPIHAEVPSLIGNSWLNLSGDFDLELGQGLKFLQQTPLRHIPQRLSKALDAQGQAHLDLRLAVPLNEGETAVNGLLQLKNDSLLVKGTRLKVQDLSGELRFTETGLAGEQIAGKALDEPILIDLEQPKDDILAGITGKASIAALRQAVPSDFWQYVEGGFDYRLDLQIPKSLDSSGTPLRVNLASSLEGLELKLPAPLVKPAAQKQDFNAALNFRRGGDASLSLAYGSEGRAKLLLADNGERFKLKGGEVSWGRSPAPADGGPGLGLYLKLAQLDADRWRKFLGELGLDNSPATPRGFDIQIGRLIWDGEEWGKFKLTGNREDNILAGEIDCRYATGIYTAENLGSDYAALKMELDSLNLPHFSQERDKQASKPPSSLPELRIHARQLWRQGADLGELQLETVRNPAGLDIRQLTLRSQNHTLRLNGAWTRQDGRDDTRIEGRLNVHDLGEFLGLLGYSREIANTPTDSAFSLSWPGTPQQFSPANLSGKVGLNMRRGSVLQVEPGLGRALGMLNLQTLRRLVLLDFSDLFGKGLSYDSMKGDFDLQAGQAKTQGFVIDAAAADILIIGRVGLADHDLDEIVSVMPHPLATLPLAVPMVGGAAIGALIDMAQRIVGAEESNLASSNYSVTGSWDSPVIKRVQGSTPLEIVQRTWSRVRGMSGAEDGERE